MFLKFMIICFNEIPTHTLHSSHSPLPALYLLLPDFSLPESQPIFQVFGSVHAVDPDYNGLDNVYFGIGGYYIIPSNMTLNISSDGSLYLLQRVDYEIRFVPLLFEGHFTFSVTLKIHTFST